MRTTVTLDRDTESTVRRLMAERGVSFKRALNDAVRAGTTREVPAPFRTRTHQMGQPTVDLDRALQIAGELDDTDFVREVLERR